MPGVDSRKCICVGLVNLEVNFFPFFLERRRVTRAGNGRIC